MQYLVNNYKPSQISKSISCNNQFDDLTIEQKLSGLKNDVIVRSNSVPFHNETLRSKRKRNDSHQIFDHKTPEIKIPLMPVSNKISDICQSRKVSDTSKKSHESESDKNIKTTGSVQKWNKLRTVMTMTAAMKTKRNLERQDSFIKKFTTQRGIDNEFSPEESQCLESENVQVVKTSLIQKFIIDSQGGVMCTWLGVVTLAVLYNLWTCIARQAFSEIRIGFENIWIVFDICADIIYLLDIGIQMRTSYLERGLYVLQTKKLAKKYINSKSFVLDLITLTPLDVIQVYIGFQPLIRFPRFLKVYRAWKWKVIMENRTILPNLWRVVNLTHILFLGCHWFAAFYFMISQVGNFESNWGYQILDRDSASVTRKYLKSFYWSTLTLTTIGDLPPPERNWEYVFTIVSYLIGVFVFATIVGQVGNVITNRNANRLEFEKILDNAKNYMRVHNVPKDLQRRVMRWYDYAWSRGRTSGCSDIASLALLPDKLKTEMALHVNLETLKKVTIFQECRPEFLHDLVLKMRPFIFTPGDLICRKGEVAREMFIISDGVLEVISDSGDVLKKMGSGDFFGEIGILNLDGGVNRRTADVKSVGYAELFVLSKEDVLSALKDHPDAEQENKTLSDLFHSLSIECHKPCANNLGELWAVLQAEYWHTKEEILTSLFNSKASTINQNTASRREGKLIVKYGTSRLNEMKDRRVQRIIKNKSNISGLESGNQSMEKSDNNSLIVIENPILPNEWKPAEIQSLSVFKNLFNRIRFNKPSNLGNINCNHGIQNNCSSSVLKNSFTCEDCAIANLANEITRESVVGSSVFNRHTNDSRLNSVPSTLQQPNHCEINNFNTSSCWYKQNINPNSPWKKSQLIPKNHITKRQGFSSLATKFKSEIQNKDLGEISPLNTISISDNNPNNDQDEIDLVSGACQIFQNHPDSDNANYSQKPNLDLFDNETINNQIKLVTETEISTLIASLETIFANKMSQIVLPLQSELKRLQTLCSNQKTEILHLQDAIKKVTTDCMVTYVS